MKTVALISGGKDSCYNMMCCIAEGHDVVALANLRPKEKVELDSYMYQSVGCSAVDIYAEAMGLHLYTHEIGGSSLSIGETYEPQDEDEVEDLYKLLLKIKEEMNIEAVSVGAIFSDYQRVRVEHVCGRLGLTTLAYLWRRDQEELLREMIECGVKAKIIKVAALGLQPDKHLMCDLDEILPYMIKMKAKLGLNVCGEGGEYETFVYDCPLFKKKIILDKIETVIHSDDAFAPVGYINILSCILEDKPWNDNIPIREKLLQLPIMTTERWIEENVSPPAVGNTEGSSVDMVSTGLVMCVPQMQITGEEEVCMQTDGKTFQIAGVIAPKTSPDDVTDTVQAALGTLRECLASKEIGMSDIATMSLYVGNMANFAAINNIYKTFFDVNPPARVCVQANLPGNIVMQLDCQGVISQPHVEPARKTLHVQGISHWAPANIGPYSQAVVCDSKLYLAGIVPLVPSTLEVVKGGLAVQCAVSLLHVQSIMKAIYAECTLGHCPLVVCYLISQEYITTARHEWKKALEGSTAEKPAFSPMVQYCVVPALPKGCLVEWHMYAWPFIGDDVTIQELKHVQEFELYTITATTRNGKEDRELFSCRLTLDAHESSDIRQIDVFVMVKDLLDQYSKICEQLWLAEMAPLVKVFYSPVVFDYCTLQHSFGTVISSLDGLTKIYPPVVSLVAVNSLRTGKQLLAWCQ